MCEKGCRVTMALNSFDSVEFYYVTFLFYGIVTPGMQLLVNISMLVLFWIYVFRLPWFFLNHIIFLGAACGAAKEDTLITKTLPCFEDTCSCVLGMCQIYWVLACQIWLQGPDHENFFSLMGMLRHSLRKTPSSNR